MNVAEAAAEMFESFSNALQALADCLSNALEKLSELLDPVAPNRKAPITLDRPLLGADYPETFKYLRTKRRRGESYA